MRDGFFNLQHFQLSQKRYTNKKVSCKNLIFTAHFLFTN